MLLFQRLMSLFRQLRGWLVACFHECGGKSGYAGNLAVLWGEERQRLAAADRPFVGLEPLEPRLLLSVTPVGAELSDEEHAHAEQAIELFESSPALFIENQGQWADESVRLLHEGDGAHVAMTDSGPVFRLFRPTEPEGAEGEGDDVNGGVKAWRVADEKCGARVSNMPRPLRGVNGSSTGSSGGGACCALNP